MAKVIWKIVLLTATLLMSIALGALAFDTSLLQRIYLIALGPTIIFPALISLGLLLLAVTSLIFVSWLKKSRSAQSAAIALAVAFSGAAAGLTGQAILSGATAAFAPVSFSRESIRASQNLSQIDYQISAEHTSFESYYRQAFSATVFSIPYSLNYEQNGHKPTAYLAAANDEVLVVQGDGSVLMFNRAALSTDVMKIKSIPSNLDEVLDEPLRKNGSHSIKGAVFHDETLWISANAISQVVDGVNCWNTSVFTAPYNSQTERFNFSKFYSPEDCALESNREFEVLQAGGAMGFVSGTKIGESPESVWMIVSQGDYRDRRKAQLGSSDLGSLVAVDTEKSSRPKLLAKGVRNVQSLVVSDNGLFFVDQGPAGGDEVNFLDFALVHTGSTVNFGWPKSSYGNHYRDALRPDAPLNPSHADYGFTEPIFVWKNSIGVSSIAANPWSPGGLLAGGMGDDALQGDLSLNFLEPAPQLSGSANLSDLLNLDDRVRDIVSVPKSGLLVATDSNEILWITELPN